MNNPKFSIVIPAYNSEQYISKGLQSIVTQTFDDYELIVVCDSCHDNTEQIAKSYGAKTLAVNYGADGLTRDAGIQLAKGEWLMFMDDDDWYLHEYCFEELAKVVGKHDEDMLAFSYIWKGRGYMRHTQDNLFFPELAHVWSRCWRRETVGDVRFGNARFCSDTYFLKRMKNKVKRSVIWDNPIYYYNFMRTGSQSELLANRKIYSSLIAR